MTERLLPGSLNARMAAIGADLELIRSLRDLHDRQWDLEDRARSTHAADADIVAVKRAIDASNGERHRLIDAIDESLEHHRPRAGGRLWVETVGELCDRLLILELKARRSAQLARDPDLPPDAREGCVRQELRFRAWRDHLAQGMERLLDDLMHGLADLPPRSELKMYDVAVLNPVTRMEMRAPH